MKKFSTTFKNIPKGVKASVALFLSTLVTKGIAYVTTPIYTRLLTDEQYGQASLFLSWMYLLGIVAMFGLSYGIFNNGMIDYPDDRDNYSFSLLMLSNIITLVFSALLIGFYPILSQWIRLELPYIFLLCAIFMFQPAYNFWVSRQRYELRYKGSFIWAVLSSLLSPLVAVICILLAEEDGKLFARLFGAEGLLIAIYIGFYIYLGIKAKFKVKTKYWKEALLFNLPLLPHYLSIYLLNNSDKLLISYLVGDAEVAYYSVAYSVAAALVAVWTAVNASLVPFTYEKCHSKEYKDISKVILPILTAFAVMCTLLIMLAPEIVAIMAPANYLQAIYVIPPVVGGVFFQIQYHIYGNVVFYYKKPKYLMFASFTAAIVHFVLNYFLISKYGFIAAGYVTLICYFIQAALDYVAMRRVLKEQVYDMKYIGLLSLVVTVIALFSNLTYSNAVIRYGIVAVLIILCIIFRKHLISMITALRRKKSP